jgi:hypothetical protein
MKLNKKKIHTMLFIMNAMEHGWTVKKRNESYIFIKKHEQRREVFKETYLEDFVFENMQEVL